MKKYIKLLPLIIYPYAYLIWLILQFTIGDTVKKLIGENGSIILFKIIFVIFNVYCCRTRKTQKTDTQNTKKSTFGKKISPLNKNQGA